jgi:hypothetical protein
MFERPHVVQAVGELHQQHAHILRHGKQQLPEVFGLRRFLGDQIELGLILVSPSTRAAISLPNFSSISWCVASVSSTVS